MNRSVKRTLIGIGIAVAYALIVRIVFGLEFRSWDDFFEVMSITFLFLLPAIVGAITVYLSSYEQAKSIAYRIVTPWLSVLFFLVITMIFEIEGWACWIMILPVFFLMASIGGLFGGYLKTRRRKIE